MKISVNFYAPTWRDPLSIPITVAAFLFGHDTKYQHVSISWEGYTLHLTTFGLLHFPDHEQTEYLHRLPFKSVALYVDRESFYSRIVSFAATNPKITYADLLRFTVRIPVKRYICTDLAQIALGYPSQHFHPKKLFWWLHYLPNRDT